MKQRQTGLSIIVRMESEFNELKRLIGEKSLYLNWVDAMAERETAVVIRANKSTQMSTGSVGCAEIQRQEGIKTITLEEYKAL